MQTLRSKTGISHVSVAIVVICICASVFLIPAITLADYDPVKCEKWRGRHRTMVTELPKLQKAIDATQGKLALDFDNERLRANFETLIRRQVEWTERLKKINQKIEKWCTF